MTKLIAIATLLFSVIFLSPNVVMGETLDDLVKRNGLYFKKFSDTPFTGKTSGQIQGSFKNGKKVGAWVSYWFNGQLISKGNYKNGEKDGAWVGYWITNGQLMSKGNYKNGEREGAWVYYRSTGQLWQKGNYKNGEREGAWVVYHEYGTVNNKETGTFKNGLKISD